MKASHKTVSERSEVLARIEIPPTADMVKKVLGPFVEGATPKLTTRLENVDPPDSLVRMIERLDDVNGRYRLIYLFQNYGTKTVSVTIRRID